MKKYFSILFIVFLIIAVTASPTRAQSEDELQLGLSRDWGYGGFGNDIQGLFSMKIKNPPSDVIKVVFLIDGNPIGEDNQAPFSLQFNTDSYPLGTHNLTAVGYTSTGEERTSNFIQSEFVPASAGGGTITKILIPVIGLVVVLVLVTALGPMILNKGKLSSLAPGTPRKYGIGGGAICPKCSRPFPLRLWWINLGWNKIDRCPYCGKWSFVRPRSLSELRQAEETELKSAQSQLGVYPQSTNESISRALDDSKYQDN